MDDTAVKQLCRIAALGLILLGCKAAPRAPTAPPRAAVIQPTRAVERVQEPPGRPAVEPVASEPVVEPAKAQPVTAKAAPEVRVAAFDSHQFYGVYVSGQKAGWAEERIAGLPDGGIRLSTRVQLRIERLGSRMDLELSDEVEYEPLDDGGALRRFETVESTGGARAVRRGELRAGKMWITIESAGATSQQNFDPPRERAEDTLPLLVVKRLRAAGGKAIQTWQFDRQSMKNVSVETTLLSEKKTRISGVPTTVLEVKGVDAARGITMVNRLTEGGRTLEMTLGPGLKLVLEDEKVAKNPAVVVPDLYRLSVVPVDQALGDAGSVGRLKLRLDGLPERGLTLVDDRQTRDGNVVEVRRLALADLPQSELAEADRVRWLEATAFIDHEHSLVRAAVTESARGATDLEKVVAMTRAVHRGLTYTLATAPLTASAILKDGRGDCTEYARVLAAMARAAGLPAREVSGMAYAGDSDPGFAFHAWVEVFLDGRWFAVDPTWDQAPVDATHIALSRDDPAAIVGLLGGLKAVVLEKE